MIVDMKNRIVFITGSTDGIGKQTAIELAKMGATILVHGRNSQRGVQAAEEIKAESKNDKIDSFFADLLNFDQIKEMSAEIHKKYDHIDVLINNAGVYQNEKNLTQTGLEFTFAINHLAHFLLTYLLLDLVKKGKSSRIVIVASQVQANRVKFDNLQAEKNFSPYSAYALSKTSNIMFTYDLAEKLKEDGITVNCLHPGVINTKMLMSGFGAIGSPLSVGASNEVFVATDPEIEGVTGKYFKDKVDQESTRVTYKAETRQKLWEISEKLTGITY